MDKSVDIMKALYKSIAAGDDAPLVAAMDSRIEWREAENSPYAGGNPYIGPEAAGKGVFEPLAADFEDFTVTPLRFIDGGDTIVVEGRYRGTRRGTGQLLDAQFVHVWELRNGRLVGFQQYTDTKQWAEAMGSGNG